MPRRWGRKYYDSGNVPEYNYPEDQPNPPENSVRNFRSFLEKIGSPSRTSGSSSLLNECIIANALTDTGLVPICHVVGSNADADNVPSRGLRGWPAKILRGRRGAVSYSGLK